MRTPSLLLVLCLFSVSLLGADEKPSAETKPEKPVAPANGPGKAGKPGEGPRRGPDGSFFRQMDKDGDGAISKEEAGERWERLGRLDKDGDGKVTMQELAAMAPGRPGEGRPGMGGGQMFGRLDKNKDGKISKDEAPAEMWERLARLDKDGDAALSKEEMAVMAPGRPGEGRPGMPGRPGLAGPGGPEAMFSRFDGDKDGKLSKSEVPAEMWERLSKADENADGLVSKTELESVFRAREGGAPGRPALKKEGTE